MSQNQTLNPDQMRVMLGCMQDGEISVARGVEILELWLAGNYRDDLLPPPGTNSSPMPSYVNPRSLIDDVLAENHSLLHKFAKASVEAAQLRELLGTQEGCQPPSTLAQEQIKLNIRLVEVSRLNPPSHPDGNFAEFRGDNGLRVTIRNCPENVCMMPERFLENPEFELTVARRK